MLKKISPDFNQIFIIEENSNRFDNFSSSCSYISTAFFTKMRYVIMNNLCCLEFQSPQLKTGTDL